VAKENSFQELFNTIKAVQRAKFIGRWVWDCRTGTVERSCHDELADDSKVHAGWYTANTSKS